MLGDTLCVAGKLKPADLVQTLPGDLVVERQVCSTRILSARNLYRGEIRDEALCKRTVAEIYLIPPLDQRKRLRRVHVRARSAKILRDPRRVHKVVAMSDRLQTCELEKSQEL